MSAALPAGFGDLRRLVRERLTSIASSPDPGPARSASAVLFLLSCDGAGRPVLVLTKRSALVSQPGDLCSPGGRVSPLLDALLAGIFSLPGGPLYRRFGLRTGNSRSERLYSATALRETAEETGLRPRRVELLGRLPERRLLLFEKVIHPVCGWSEAADNLKPNREVEKIVRIPLGDLLEAGNYAAYDIYEGGGSGIPSSAPLKETICFVHRDNDGAREILWGAALSITLEFLRRVFDFSPPDRDSLPLIRVTLPSNYRRHRRGS